MLPHRILVVRNDKLGDFMLAWPALRVLKEHLPNTELYVLVPAYTRPIAELCPWVDGVVEDNDNSSIVASLTLGRRIAGHHFDAAITLFSTGRVGFALWRARIPVRFAPATKLAQLFYNHRLVQRRSRSEKPEFAYNLDLAIAYLQRLGITQVEMPQAPYLHFPEREIAPIRETLRRQLSLSQGQPLVFVHPGSGGSAANLTIDQYGMLCNKLRSRGGHGIAITAGPGEEARAEALAQRLGPLPHAVLETQPLPQLARQLQAADLFISGSTGPLHIAGALDCPTAAFYPGHRSGTSLRWQTLNSSQRRLAFAPPPGGNPKQVSRIDVTAAAEIISKTFLS